MTRIDELIGDGRCIAIAGHVNPDGDCIGSTMGLYLYLKKNRPELTVDVYLEKYRSVFSYISCLEDSQKELRRDIDYDTLIIIDVSSLDRIGVAAALYDKVSHVICIDHHVTNPGLGQDCILSPEASSASEVVYELLDPVKVDQPVAEALYTGIIHDTGIFQYPNTGKRTMEIAGALMEKGINFSHIINHSFNERSHRQARILGYVLENSRLYEQGRVIVGCITPENEQQFGTTKRDYDGIVSQLRLTAGVDVALFFYPAEEGAYKVSFRSQDKVNVSRIAGAFGGGGHVRASGATLTGTFEDCRDRVLKEVEKEL